MKIPGTTSSRLERFLDGIRELSRTRKIIIVLAGVCILTGLFAWFVYLPITRQIETLETDLKKKQTRLAVIKAKVKQLSRLEAEFKESREKFEFAKKALPEKDEIPSLLSGITAAGLDAGLEFLLFEPKPEGQKDFYAEIPISLKVTGTYKKVGIFFEKIAKLPRIVNIREIAMTPSDDGEKLTTSCVAVTYKFVEADPTETETGAKGNTKGKPIKKSG